MVLAHDAACYIDWIDPNVLALLPHWNYLHIHQDVLPYLREHGVSDAQIDDHARRHPASLLRGHRRVLTPT